MYFIGQVWGFMQIFRLKAKIQLSFEIDKNSILSEYSLYSIAVTSYHSILYAKFLNLCLNVLGYTSLFVICSAIYSDNFYSTEHVHILLVHNI